MNSLSIEMPLEICKAIHDEGRIEKPFLKWVLEQKSLRNPVQ